MTETKAVVAQSQTKIGSPVILMPQNFNEVMQVAEFLAKSSLIPNSLRGKPADVAIVVMTGMELGIGPMQAVQKISPINGKPTTEGQLMLALIQSRCPDAGIVIESKPDKATVTMTRGKNSYTAAWDIARARALGLMEKPNYKAQLGTMLKWRAVADAARTVFSDVVLGLYTQDEAEDIREMHEVESAVVGGDKISRLAAKLADPADEIPAEIVEPAPAETVPAEVQTGDPVAAEALGDYMILAGPLNGKRIKEIPVPVLIEFADTVEAKKKKSGASPTGLLLEAVTRIDQYLEMLPAQAAESNGVFSNF